MYQIGFDIGGTNIAAGLIDDSLEIVRSESRPFRRSYSAENVAELLFSMAQSLTSGIVELDRLDSVGIAVPGSIDQKGEVVLNAYNLGFCNTPLRALAQSLFGDVPVYLGNDANAAALAELYKGAFRGTKTAVLITLGTGVGGGLILGGKMFNGGMNNGVELGHMILMHNGRQCSCGNRGCIESLCAATALIVDGREDILLNPNGMIAQNSLHSETNVTAKLVIDCAKAGDTSAKRIFSSYVDALGSASASIINLLDPEVIAIGGGICYSGEFLFEPLRDNVTKKCFFTNYAKIVPAQLKNDAGIVGAAMLKRNFEE